MQKILSLMVLSSFMAMGTNSFASESESVTKSFLKEKEPFESKIIQNALYEEAERLEPQYKDQLNPIRNLWNFALNYEQNSKTDTWKNDLQTQEDVKVYIKYINTLLQCNNNIKEQKIMIKNAENEYEDAIKEAKKTYEKSEKYAENFQELESNKQIALDLKEKTLKEANEEIQRNQKQKDDAVKDVSIIIDREKKIQLMDDGKYNVQNETMQFNRKVDAEAYEPSKHAAAVMNSHYLERCEKGLDAIRAAINNPKGGLIKYAHALKGLSFPQEPISPKVPDQNDKYGSMAWGYLRMLTDCRNKSRIILDALFNKANTGLGKKGNPDKKALAILDKFRTDFSIFYWKSDLVQEIGSESKIQEILQGALKNIKKLSKNKKPEAGIKRLVSELDAEPMIKTLLDKVKNNNVPKGLYESLNDFMSFYARYNPDAEAAWKVYQEKKTP